jgi:hypothetical protein
LERGLGYIALGPATAAATFVRSTAQAGTPWLWITERVPEDPPAGGRTLRVTTLPGTQDSVDPKRLAELRSAAAAFLARAPDGVVLLDCLEHLVLHNGPERAQRALADLHDEVTVRGGSLVVFVNARLANPRLVAWLQRELDPLPPAPGLMSEGERLLA